MNAVEKAADEFETDRLVVRALQADVLEALLAVYTNEVVYVLEFVYEVDRDQVAELVRAIVAFPAVTVPDEPLLLRTLEIYEEYRIHFAESYLAACAEISGVGLVASFDRDTDRVPSVQRLEPSA